MNIFKFKQFSVRHERSAMKVGTDAVLLGAWAYNGDPIVNGMGLDVGCGCGVITLMMAQRFTAMEWWGIELEKNAAMEANENFKNSPFDSLRAIQGDFLSWNAENKFDRITCNPPYFQSALSVDSEARQMARQEKFLPPQVFLKCAYNCTTRQGKLAVVLPPDRKTYWLEQANRVGWNVERICKVSGNREVKESRYLIQWSKEMALQEVAMDELVLEEVRGVRTNDFFSLTQDFYL